MSKKSAILMATMMAGTSGITQFPRMPSYNRPQSSGRTQAKLKADAQAKRERKQAKRLRDMGK